MNKLKILIIEDDLIYANKLKNWLSEYSINIGIETTSEGGALYASEYLPDVIFVDNLLPGVNGKDSIELFKNVLCPNAYVVLMSSKTPLPELENNGADYILDKSNLGKTKLNELLSKALSLK